MKNKLINFGAGPSKLPEEVIEKAKEAIFNFHGTGIGILEISHRDPSFESLLELIKVNLRELIKIPDNYEIIFCTGGATNQFSMVPLNFANMISMHPEAELKEINLNTPNSADYIVSGIWSDKAAKEATKFLEVNVITNSGNEQYKTIPTKIKLSDNPKYLYFNSNDTIYGVQFDKEPESNGVPLVCDASSDILSRDIDINKYAVYFAGAQKNLGCAGVTLVILKKGLFDNDLAKINESKTALMLNYSNYIKHNSLYNTPPTFSIYVMYEMLEWIKKIGIKEIESQNSKKGSEIYGMIDQSQLYIPYADKSCRSNMNVTFHLRDKTLEDKFFKSAKEEGLYGIKGHRLLGGGRISLYNAVSLSEVQILSQFMKEFERKA